MKLILTSLTTGLLLSSCTYHNTYIEPKPTPVVVTKRPTPSKPATVTTKSTAADGFQAVTKPSSYSN